MAYDILGDIQFFKKWNKAIARLLKGKSVLNRKESLKFINDKKHRGKIGNYRLFGSNSFNYKFRTYNFK